LISIALALAPDVLVVVLIPLVPLVVPLLIEVDARGGLASTH